MNVRLPIFFFFSSRRRHTRSLCDWSSDVCSSDLSQAVVGSGDTPYFADVNGDGKQDLIIVNSSTVSVMLGNSNGSGFLAPLDFTGGPFFGTAGTFFADVDGDGKADAIAVNTRRVFSPKLGMHIVRDISVRRSIWTSFGPTIEAWGS